MDVLINATLCKLAEPEILNETWILKKLNQGCRCEDLAVDTLDKIICHRALQPTPFLQIIFSIILTTIIFLSIGGNSLVIWIILKHKKMRKAKNFFLLNLSATNLFAVVVVATVSGYYAIYQKWVFPSFYCVVSHVISVTTINVCSFTMISMSAQRYRAIITPFKKAHGFIKTLICIVAIWVSSIAFAIPYFFISSSSMIYYVDPSENSISKQYACFDDELNNILVDIYKYGLVFIQFLLPLICFFVIYGRVLHSLCCKPVVIVSSNAATQKQKKKAGKMIIFITISFFVLWLPYNLYSLFIKKALKNDEGVTHIVFNIVFNLAMSTCFVDPGIYFLMNKRFNIGLRYIFRWIPFVKFDRETYDKELAN